MQVRSSFTVKSLLDVEAGEFFQFRLNGGRAVGIALRRLQGGALKIGVLRADAIEGPKPFLFDFDDPDFCLSYGKDWVIEPEPGPETLAGNMQHTETNGALHVTETGIALRLNRSPQSPNGSGFSFDLVNGGAATLKRDECVPVLRWRIWASADAPRFPGEKPLFEFDAGAPAA